MVGRRPRKKDRKLLDSYHGLPCLICESEATTVAHHIISKGAGGDDAEYNLVPLCIIHHGEIHRSLRLFALKHEAFQEFLNQHGWEYEPFIGKWLNKSHLY